MLSCAHPGPIVTVLWCGWPDGPPGPRAVEVCLSCQTGGLSSLGVPRVNETGRRVTGLWFRVRAAPPGGCGQAGARGGAWGPARPLWPSPGAPSLCASAWGEGPLPARMGPPCRAAQTAGPRGEHGLRRSPPSRTHLPVLASQTRPPSRLPCSPGSGPRWPEARQALGLIWVRFLACWGVQRSTGRPAAAWTCVPCPRPTPSQPAGLSLQTSWSGPRHLPRPVRCVSASRAPDSLHPPGLRLAQAPLPVPGLSMRTAACLGSRVSAPIRRLLWGSAQRPVAHVSEAFDSASFRQARSVALGWAGTEPRG